MDKPTCIINTRHFLVINCKQSPMMKMLCLQWLSLKLNSKWILFFFIISFLWCLWDELILMHAIENLLVCRLRDFYCNPTGCKESAIRNCVIAPIWLIIYLSNLIMYQLKSAAFKEDMLGNYDYPNQGLLFIDGWRSQ